MNKDEFERIVGRYLNGQATDEDLALLDRWFKLTEASPYYLTEERKNIIAARLLPRLEAIAQSYSGSKSGTSGLLRHFANRFYRIAAVLILVIAVTGIPGWIFRRQLMERISPVARQSIMAGAHELKKIRLPDQTLVTLDTGASISFPVAYRGSERSVDLKGKAFFEVAKNTEQSFIVHTSTLDIKVLGTSFVVADQNLISTVSVVTGKVSVAADKRLLTELRPGLQLSYNRQTAGASLQTVDPHLMTAWTKRCLSFAEAPLEQVLAAIAQKWNVPLILPSAASGKQFSGDFSDADSLDDMMKAVALATGIRWERTASGAIIIKYHP